MHCLLQSWSARNRQLIFSWRWTLWADKRRQRCREKAAGRHWDDEKAKRQEKATCNLLLPGFILWLDLFTRSFEGVVFDDLLVFAIFCKYYELINITTITFLQCVFLSTLFTSAIWRHQSLYNVSNGAVTARDSCIATYFRFQILVDFFLFWIFLS